MLRDVEMLLGMGLPRAIEAHRANDLNAAETHYRRAYEQGQVNETFYQNFGALLRQQGKLNESKKFYEEGLRRFPTHHGIKRNYANQLRHEKPSYAIELYLSLIRSSPGQDGDASLVTKLPLLASSVFINTDFPEPVVC